MGAFERRRKKRRALERVRREEYVFVAAGISIDQCPVCAHWVPGIDSGEIHEGSDFVCVGPEHHDLVAVVDGEDVRLVRQENDDDR